MAYKDWPPLANFIGHAVDGYADATGQPIKLPELLRALEVIRYAVTEAWIKSGVQLPAGWVVPPKPPKESA